MVHLKKKFIFNLIIFFCNVISYILQLILDKCYFVHYLLFIQLFFISTYHSHRFITKTYMHI